MSKKFVSFKQIAGALEISECTLRRKAEVLGINQARDKIFKNRYLTPKVQRALKDRDYDICF